MTTSRNLRLIVAAGLPATLFLDWFEVAGRGRFSGWESFHRSDLILVALCVGVIACEAIPRRRGLSLVQILLAGGAVAMISAELTTPPAGSDITTVLLGGKAALVIAGVLLGSTLWVARPGLGDGRAAEVWGVLLFPSALLAVLGWAHRFTDDDAFITYRVVDQVLAGNGPVFNTGERVEAYTSALWLAILVVVHGVLGFVALEWIAVVLGLLLSVAGLAAATVGARLLHDQQPGMVVPVGALVFVALPPAWDFATSGLETGLWFAWLGGVFLALVAAERNPGWASRRGRRPSWLDLLAVAIGLGPLIRPDFAIFSAAFFIALLAVQRPTSVRSALRPLVLMVALPIAYQVFRMGYFAALVPNTALTKEAGLSRWGQGAAYAWDTLGTYWLLVPLVLLGAWLAYRLRGASRTHLLLALLPVAAGALHIVYVIKVGGDFMHGRLILPGLFALLMPVAALPLSPHRIAASLAAATVAIWAVVATTELRTSYTDAGQPSDRGFADEAGDYALQTGHQNPVTLDHFRHTEAVAIGTEAKRRAESGDAILLAMDEGYGDFASSGPGLRRPTVLFYTHYLGQLGYAAGPEVHVVDVRALADPIGSRFRLEQRGRPGHEKLIDIAWAIARFGDPGSGWVDVPSDCTDCRRRRRDATDQVPAAERALQCGTLHDVLQAVTEPMSVSRFFENLALAPRATALRFAAKPDAAARELCD